MLDLEFSKLITWLILLVENPGLKAKIKSPEVEVARRELSSIWSRLIRINHPLSFAISVSIWLVLLGEAHGLFSTLLHNYDIHVHYLVEVVVLSFIIAVALPVIQYVYDSLRVLLMLVFCGSELRKRLPAVQS